MTWLATALLFFLSGIPALVYQVAWQRMLALLSGVGSFSISTIVAGFMAGLGLGSLVGGWLSQKLGTRQSLLCFGLVEAAIGLCGHWSYDHGLNNSLVPQNWYVGSHLQIVAAHLLVLLIPTTLMGMTFPLLTSALVGTGRRSSHVIGLLYALNLLGAATGSLMTPWILFPALGISGTLRIISSINFLIAICSICIALTLSKTSPAIATNNLNTNVLFDEPDPSIVTKLEKTEISNLPRFFWYLIYGSTGAISIGLEILWFRLVDVGSKATSYTFGTVLCVYLLGMAIGTLLAVFTLKNTKHPLLVFLASQLGVALTTLLPILILIYLPRSTGFSQSMMDYWYGYEPLSPVHSGSWPIIRTYVIFPMTLFFVPTIFMGYSFVALQEGVQTDRQLAGLRLGLLQAVNIAGCVVGSLVVGLFGFTFFGTGGSFRLLLLGYLLIFLFSMKFREVRSLAIAGTTLILLLIALSPSNSRLWQRLHGQSTSANLITGEDQAGVTALLNEGGSRWRVSTNGKGQSYIPFGGVHSKLGALPATFLDNPKRIAIIGLGSGDTAWAAACRSETEIMEIYEVCSNQMDLLKENRTRISDAHLNQLLSDKRVRFIGEDGRIGLRKSVDKYDLIEADAIRPNGAYAGNLYSREFFEECRLKLAAGGVMCTWCPTPRTLETFQAVFPHVIKLDGGQILIGSNDSINLNLNAWKARINSADLSHYLGEDIVRECDQGLSKAELLLKSDATNINSMNSDLYPLDEFEVQFKP